MSGAQARYSLAVDIGGTFTDVVLRAGDGRLWVDKTLTTPHDLLDGFFTAVDQALGKAEIMPQQVDDVIVHATTVVTNALIERKGPRTALLVTEGFRDVLWIRDEHRYEMFDPQIEFPVPLVPRELTFGVRERVFEDGTIGQPVAAADIANLIEQLRAAGVQSVAITLLNSFRNPANEIAVADALATALPDLYVSRSSEVAPQIREYPRASTTVINAYTAPITQPYLRALTRRLAAEGFPNDPLMMLSNGGVIGVDLAGRFPVRMIESGPAAGALAASYWAERLGLDRVMSFDMGGTTAKACLIENHAPLVTGTFEVDRIYRFKAGSGLPVTIPSIDMIEIGAGGGSIASVDRLGLLKVGPRSAGSKPGPACYGRGGTEATVTDADLVLGLLDPDNFLGGDMKLDLAASQAAIARLAERLGTSTAQTASGIYRVVAETMASATRAHATDRGVDQRGMILLAFGGAGPVHACTVAELLHGSCVVFPPQASVLSAFGTLVTPARLDLVRSALGALEHLSWPIVDDLIGEMERESRAALAEAGVPADAIRFVIGADLRYRGQQNEVSVSLPADPRHNRDTAAIRAAFEAAYLAQYGIVLGDVDVEIVTWRLTAQGPLLSRHGIAPLAAKSGTPKHRRPVGLWASLPPVEVWDRVALADGQVIRGPALVEERETTIVIPPGWAVRVDPTACLIANRD